MRAPPLLSALPILLSAVLTTATLLSTPTPTPSPDPSAASESTCPFITPIALLPLSDSDSPDQQHPFFHLLPRQQSSAAASSCPSGFAGCGNLGVPQACCATTATCTTDPLTHVACCLIGASCTGTIGATGAATSPVGGTGGTTTVVAGQSSSGSDAATGTVVATSGVVITLHNGVERGGLQEWVLMVLVGVVGAVLRVF